MKQFKKIIGRFTGFFPTPLPQGMTQFNDWIDSFIETYEPRMDARSVRWVVATLMMRVEPTEAFKSKRYFALCLHKGAAAQVASQVMHDIKQEQEVEQQAAQLAAATPTTDAATSPNGDAVDVSIQN